MTRKLPGPHGTRLFLTIAMAPLAALAAAAGDHGLRFDSAGVLDLANRDLRVEAGRPLDAVVLADDEAARIFAAPAIGEEPLGLSFSDDVYGCRKPSPRCSQEHERGLIAASAGAAKRDGKRLTITSTAGAAAVFVDWRQPATKTADGDAETHWYLGALPGSGYHRVEVEFGHDAPGDFLIDPQSGKVAFVHNAADLAVPSPDGRLLLTWNSLNPPLSLRVAALDAGGPRLVLQCEAAESGQPLTPVFKGWSAPARFDVVVELGPQSKSQRRLALRLQRGAGGWQLQSSSATLLAATALACEGADAKP